MYQNQKMQNQNLLKKGRKQWIALFVGSKQHPSGLASHSSLPIPSRPHSILSGGTKGQSVPANLKVRVVYLRYMDHIIDKKYHAFCIC